MGGPRQAENAFKQLNILIVEVKNQNKCRCGEKKKNQRDLTVNELSGEKGVSRDFLFVWKRVAGNGKQEQRNEIDTEGAYEINTQGT